MNLQITAVLVGFLALASNARADGFNLPCANQADCADIPMAICTPSAGRCECPDGFFFNGEMTKCLAASTGFGAACEEDVQCSARMLTGASCSASAKCECVAGYHYLHGRCWKSRGLGEQCSSSAQCYGNFNHEALSCAAGACQCSEGYYLHPAGTYCRRAAEKPGDECVFDIDCKFEGGLCNQADQTCVSSTDRGARWLPRTSQLSWTHDQNAEPSTFTAAQPTAKFGEPCAGDGACRAADPNSECSAAGTCWCALGFYSVSGVCKRELGEPCELDGDCTHITNGTCRARPTEGSICSCNVYSIPGANNQRCNRLRPELEINCQSQMETCQNFGPLCNCVVRNTTDIKCRCLDGSHFEDELKACWLSKGLGESCTAQQDCIVASGKTSVECGAEGTCKCVNSFHENTGDCLKDSLVFGEECLTDIDCLFPNSKCGDGFCSCKPGYFPSDPDDGTVTCQTGIGGACTIDGDCSKVANSVCNTTSSSCVCNADEQSPLVASDSYDECLPVALTYGGACTESVQCQSAFGENSTCANNTCACLDSFHFVEDGQICWEKTDLHGRCFNERDCFVPSGNDHTDCINGYCKCLYNYVEDVETMDCVSSANAVHQKFGALASLVACFLLAAML